MRDDQEFGGVAAEGRDHWRSEDHWQNVPATISQIQAVGHVHDDTHEGSADSLDTIPEFAAVQRCHVTQRITVSGETNPAMPDGLIDQHHGVFHERSVDQATISAIREQWRRRQQWHRAEKSLTLQAKALCRRLAVNGDKKEADVIYNAALGKGEHPESMNAFGAIFPLVEARDGVEKHRKKVEKELAKLAAKLPVAQFVLATRGVGIASLAAIVGEAGDLGNYATVQRLWKRMGLAVMPDGTRQRRIAGDNAIEHGYSPSRRSVAWNIGSCIVKAGGPLKSIYDDRKVYELTRVETKAHAHNRAQRYVEKRFLALLWAEWRRASNQVSLIRAVPAAEPFNEAE